MRLTPHFLLEEFTLSITALVYGIIHEKNRSVHLAIGPGNGAQGAAPARRPENTGSRRARRVARGATSQPPGTVVALERDDESCTA